MLLLGGYQEGKDETLTSSAYGSRNKNKGYFAEADETARGLRRYDSYDLSDLKSGDKRTRYMVVANKALANGLQAIE